MKDEALKLLSDEFIYKVVRSAQPHLDDDCADWRNHFAECKYWLEIAHGIATPTAAQQEPVFCDYCGGNDEDPQDHCMDCTRPRWEPVTQKLLNAQHSWLYKDMWIAMKDGSVMTGYYKWMQGRCPDRFIVGDCASLWAFEATHVMPMNKPKHPNEGKNT
jgi:hypothetical protein